MCMYMHKIQSKFTMQYQQCALQQDPSAHCFVKTSKQINSTHYVDYHAIYWGLWYSIDMIIKFCYISTYCTLTHWGRVMHICVSKLTIIGSDNVLSPGRRQAIIWTNAGILLIRPLGTNFSEILIRIQTFSFKKMHLKMSSANWRPFCLGLNVLTSTVASYWGFGVYFHEAIYSWGLQWQQKH